ncbi:unnamed protein product [Rhizopus stolonifer]
MKKNKLSFSFFESFLLLCNQDIMFFRALSSFVVLGLLAIITFPSASDATSLTYNFAANERSCFYTMTDQPGKKIGFYFAVQQGGDFDIDYEVTGPRAMLF